MPALPARLAPATGLPSPGTGGTTARQCTACWVRTGPARPPPGNLFAAGAGTYLLALLFASVTYAVGAAPGAKSAAVAVGAGLAAGTYLIFALASFVALFENLRWLSPWYWFLEPSPLEAGWTWQATDRHRGGAGRRDRRPAGLRR